MFSKDCEVCKQSSELENDSLTQWNMQSQSVEGDKQVCCPQLAVLQLLELALLGF